MQVVPPATRAAHDAVRRPAVSADSHVVTVLRNVCRRKLAARALVHARRRTGDGQAERTSAGTTREGDDNVGGRGRTGQHGRTDMTKWKNGRGEAREAHVVIKTSQVRESREDEAKAEDSEKILGVAYLTYGVGVCKNVHAGMCAPVYVRT